MVNCLLTFLKGKSTLFLVETKRLLTWREEDSSTRKILQCGSSQRHSQIQFTCKGLYLPLALRSSQLRGWKILVLARYQHHLNCLRYRQKIQYQGQTKQKQRRVGQCLITAIKAKHYLATGRSVPNHGNKGQALPLALPGVLPSADCCDNSA